MKWRDSCLIKAHYEWQLNDFSEQTQADQLAKQLNISPIVAELLVERGMTTQQEASQFLTPQLDTLHDPMQMHDMQKAVTRITTAIEEGQRITVYGDYDADGVTSTALMYETLLTLGANVNYYVPNRFTDGYGPNVKAFGQLIDEGTQLFVTVDNGVAGNDAIETANERQVDVIVTDHHELPKQLPNAFAIVHPRYPGSEYPFGDLSGVGVAFKVAWALLEELPTELLDLVAIGEVADLVSVTDENRVLISFGLQQLRQGLRPGIHELVNLAGLNEQQLTETNIGFGIAPRLNALGRMDDANVGVQLLTTLDDDEAQQLAQKTETLNQKRQKLVNDITEEALVQANLPENEDRHTLIVAGENWHEGVLGIVASRLVEQTGKPTLVLNIDSQKGQAKGSGRSVAHYDLFKAIDAYREITTAFGGHQMAVGLTIPVTEIDHLKEGLETAAAQQNFDGTTKPILTINEQIEPNQIDLTLYNQIEQLAPFGPDNLRPVFEIKNSDISAVKSMGKTNKHLKFQVGNLTTIAFNQGQHAQLLSQDANGLKLAVTIDLNEWQGRQKVQLMLKDFSLPGVQIIDQRTNKLSQQLFEKPDIYVCFSAKLAKQIEQTVNAQQIMVAQSIESDILLNQRVTLVDCPTSFEQLKALFNLGGRPSILTLLLFETNNVYLSGMPTRDEFATLYKFVNSHQNVDVHHQLTELSEFLKLDRNKLIFMIQVFFEVGFVKIDHGVLNRVTESSNADLSSAPAFKQRQAQMKTEKLLIYSDSNTLKQSILSCFDAN